jgi:MFS family permease
MLTYSVVAPLLPAYKEELAASEVELGALVASLSFGAVAGSLAARPLAARFGARVIATGGIVLTGAMSIAFGFGGTLGALIASRTVQGFGGGLLWVGGLQWLLGATPERDRGRNVGTVFGAETLGAMVGPAVGALAVTLGARAVFSGVGAVTLLLGAVAARIPLPSHDREPVSGGNGARKRLRGEPALWILMTHAAVTGLLTTLAPLLMSDQGASGALVAAVFAAGSGLAVVTSPAVGWLSDRTGRIRPLRIGCVIDALVLAGLAVSPSVSVTAALTLTWLGVVAAAVGIPSATLLVDRSGGDHGHATATMVIAFCVGSGAGALLGGALSDATSFALPFAVFATIGVLRLALLRREPRSRLEPIGG